jgi:hypothetical protein
VNNPYTGPRVEDSDATLVPSESGETPEPLYFEVNGAGAAPVPNFTPSVQELLEALRYWVAIDAEFSFREFMTQDANDPAWRLRTFAQRRIKRIREAMGHFPSTDWHIESFYDEYGECQNPIAWRVFRKRATPDEQKRFELKRERLVGEYLAEDLYYYVEDDEFCGSASERTQQLPKSP